MIVISWTLFNPIQEVSEILSTTVKTFGRQIQFFFLLSNDILTDAFLETFEAIF